MTKVLAINGSARKGKGLTQVMMEQFLEGMREEGAGTELVYASDFRINPCIGDFQCWFEKPGVCVHTDDMRTVLNKMKAADILVLGIPVYIPLPGAMQNLINRMCPLIEPVLEWRDGRTRARLHEDVRMSKLALVTVCGWWELENTDTVLRVARELALDAGMEFAGAVRRPHAGLVRSEEGEGPRVLEETREAGRQLIGDGRMDPGLLERISRPLVPMEEYRRRQTEMHERARQNPKGLW